MRKNTGLKRTSDLSDLLYMLNLVYWTGDSRLYALLIQHGKIFISFWGSTKLKGESKQPPLWHLYSVHIVGCIFPLVLHLLYRDDSQKDISEGGTHLRALRNGVVYCSSIYHTRHSERGDHKSQTAVCLIKTVLHKAKITLWIHCLSFRQPGTT